LRQAAPPTTEQQNARPPEQNTPPSRPMNDFRLLFRYRSAADELPDDE